MSSSNILKNVSKQDIDRNRLDREERHNPPDFAPGMGDDDDDLQDLFSGGLDSGSSVGDDSFGLFNTPSSGGGLGFGLGLGVQQQTPQRKSTEDIAMEIAEVSAKGVWSFTKCLIESVKSTNPKFWAKWGSRTTVVSLSLAVFGLIIKFLRVNFGFTLLLSGLLGTATGVLVLMLNVEKSRGMSKLDSTEPSFDIEDDSPNFDTFDIDSDWGDSDLDIGGYEEEDEVFDDDSVGLSLDEDLFDIADIDIDIDAPVDEPLSMEEALDLIPEMEKGVYTRQFLYDVLMRYLPSVTPDYGKVTDIDEDSDVFMAFEAVLREASQVLGSKDDNLPELIKLEESLFTVKLTITRPVNLKTELLAEEIARIYAYDDGEFNPKVYATADVVGTKCIITLFTGEVKMISLRDLMVQCKDFVLDTSNYMPVLLGVNHAGKAVYGDFRHIESLIIAGMPGSGKSWTVQNILFQFCAFIPPSELHIYIGDPKEGISDFKSFMLPHVKKFVNTDTEIVNTLKDVIKVEGSRRQRILGDAGVVNIWDFKKKYPDVKLPIIYVVVDEVVTLASRMNKDQHTEFQKLLTEGITRLRAVGIRLFLIPHVVKHDIIAKTASDTVKCRVSVGGNESHIESSTGTKPKDFKYKLVNPGDMALNIPDFHPKTQFVRGSVLTKTNDGNSDLFDYMRRVWMKLEPEEFEDSVARQVESDNFVKELLESSEDEIDMNAIFDINDD